MSNVSLYKLHSFIHFFSSCQSGRVVYNLQTTQSKAWNPSSFSSPTWWINETFHYWGKNVYICCENERKSEKCVRMWLCGGTKINSYCTRANARKHAHTWAYIALKISCDVCAIHMRKLAKNWKEIMIIIRTSCVFGIVSPHFSS